jgi:hypothetical protein
MKAAATLAGMLACLAVLVGCGAATQRVERTVVTVVKTVPVATAASEQPKTRPKRKRAVRTPASTFVACDQNISARRNTTSCPFAENTFYEYWASGEASVIRAYSPATERTYRLTCRRSAIVHCTAGDGAEVRFSSSSVSAYTDSQARAYAAAADLGPDAPIAGDDTGDADSLGYDDGSGYDDSFADPGDDGSGDEIPNYDNGRGYRVQCADGMYSQSGGIQGACSGHGGVG